MADERPARRTRRSRIARRRGMDESAKPVTQPADKEKTPTFFERAYHRDLRELECRCVRDRRAATKPPDESSADAPRPPDDAPCSELPAHCVGFALSGGGIRSATFCLGVFQSLARKRLIRHIDFLSTVSGGGYFGGALGQSYRRPLALRLARRGGVPAAQIVEECLADTASRSVRWLKENGRYLAPNGAGDMLVAGTTYLRNLVAIHVVLATAVLAVFLLVNSVRAACAAPLRPLLRRVGGAVSGLGGRLPPAVKGVFAWLGPLWPHEHGITPTSWIWWSPTVELALVAFLALVVPLGATYWLAQGEVGRKVKTWYGTVAAAIACLVGLAGWPAVAADPQPGSSVGWSMLSYITFVLVTALGWYAVISLSCARVNGIPPGAVARESYLLARRAKVRHRMSSLLTAALALALALFGFALVDSAGQTLYALLKEVPDKFLRHPTVFAPIGVLLALVAYAKKLTGILAGKLKAAGRVRLRWDVVATAVAAVLLATYLVTTAAVAHGFLWNWQVPAGSPGARLASHFEPKDKVSLSNHRYITVNPDHPQPPPSTHQMSAGAASIALLLALLACFGFGHTIEFVNLSSEHALYSQRLARAYLGASNPKRWRGKGLRVTEVMPGDDTSLADYAPHEAGGPLHIINTTLNETVSGQSNIEQRDRKGLPMAVGPCGISVGTRYHAVWTKVAPKVPSWRLKLGKAREVSVQMMGKAQSVFGKRTLSLTQPTAGPARQSTSGESRPALPTREIEALGFDPHKFHILAGKTAQHPVENLPLSAWLGVSGAAFTTGLGSRTSIGLSLLLGLTGVRLGYWWDSYVTPDERLGAAYEGLAGGALPRALAGIFPVQNYLLDEFLARFHGPARQHWYLSDGGHFENTACYELIRRRVPFIVCCDCGADPDYEFGDLANLVRKVRADFDAEMEFLPDAEGSAHAMIGSLERVKRDKEAGPSGVPLSRCHAAVARVTYPAEAGHPNRATSTILLLKPSLTGDEPLDVLNYAKEHPTFPQETTADQFFDEAQWESYRKLGQHIADHVIGPAGDDGFTTLFSPWRAMSPTSST
jgi:hypothetical protein